MKYRISKMDNQYLAEYKRWFFWHAVCYKGYRFNYDSDLDDIRRDKAFRKPAVVYKEIT